MREDNKKLNWIVAGVAGGLMVLATILSYISNM